MGQKYAVPFFHERQIDNGPILCSPNFRGEGLAGRFGPIGNRLLQCLTIYVTAKKSSVLLSMSRVTINLACVVALIDLAVLIKMNCCGAE